MVPKIPNPPPRPDPELQPPMVIDFRGKSMTEREDALEILKQAKLTLWRAFLILIAAQWIAGIGVALCALALLRSH